MPQKLRTTDSLLIDSLGGTLDKVRNSPSPDPTEEIKRTTSSSTGHHDEWSNRKEGAAERKGKGRDRGTSYHDIDFQKSRDRSTSYHQADFNRLSEKEMRIRERIRERENHMDMRENPRQSSYVEDSRMGSDNYESHEEEDRIIQYPKGDTYEGQYVKGAHGNPIPHGEGTYMFVNGGSYSGQWKNGMYNGQGKEKHSNGDKYVGDFEAGAKHGFGRFYYANGDMFQGEFNRGKSVRGVYRFANGSEFFENWTEDGTVRKKLSEEEIKLSSKVTPRSNVKTLRRTVGRPSQEFDDDPADYQGDYRSSLRARAQQEDKRKSLVRKKSQEEIDDMRGAAQDWKKELRRRGSRSSALGEGPPSPRQSTVSRQSTSKHSTRPSSPGRVRISARVDTRSKPSVELTSSSQTDNIRGGSQNWEKTLRRSPSRDSVRERPGSPRSPRSPKSPKSPRVGAETSVRGRSESELSSFIRSTGVKRQSVRSETVEDSMGPEEVTRPVRSESAERNKAARRASAERIVQRRLAEERKAMEEEIERSERLANIERLNKEIEAERMARRGSLERLRQMERDEMARLARLRARRASEERLDTDRGRRSYSPLARRGSTSSVHLGDSLERPQRSDDWAKYGQPTMAANPRMEASEKRIARESLERYRDDDERMVRRGSQDSLRMARKRSYEYFDKIQRDNERGRQLNRRRSSVELSSPRRSQRSVSPRSQRRASLSSLADSQDHELPTASSSARALIAKQEREDYIRRQSVLNPQVRSSLSPNRKRSSSPQIRRRSTSHRDAQRRPLLQNQSIKGSRLTPSPPRRMGGGAISHRGGSPPHVAFGVTMKSPPTHLIQPSSRSKKTSPRIQRSRSTSTPRARPAWGLKTISPRLKAQEQNISETHVLEERNLILGSRIRYKNMTGYIRFLGPVDFAQGIYAGLELTGAYGKHNGIVKGQRYFTCPENHGMFVRAHLVEVLDNDHAAHFPKGIAKTPELARRRSLEYQYTGDELHRRQEREKDRYSPEKIQRDVVRQYAQEGLVHRRNQARMKERSPSHASATPNQGKREPSVTRGRTTTVSSKASSRPRSSTAGSKSPMREKPNTSRPRSSTRGDENVVSRGRAATLPSPRTVNYDRNGKKVSPPPGVHPAPKREVSPSTAKSRDRSSDENTNAHAESQMTMEQLAVLTEAIAALQLENQRMQSQAKEREEELAWYKEQIQTVKGKEADLSHIMEQKNQELQSMRGDYVQNDGILAATNRLAGELKEIQLENDKIRSERDELESQLKEIKMKSVANDPSSTSLADSAKTSDYKELVEAYDKVKRQKDALALENERVINILKAGGVAALTGALDKQRAPDPTPTTPSQPPSSSNQGWLPDPFRSPQPYGQAQPIRRRSPSPGRLSEPQFTPRVEYRARARADASSSQESSQVRHEAKGRAGPLYKVDAVKRKPWRPVST